MVRQGTSGASSDQDLWWSTSEAVSALTHLRWQGNSLISTSSCKTAMLLSLQRIRFGFVTCSYHSLTRAQYWGEQFPEAVKSEKVKLEGSSLPTPSFIPRLADRY